MSLVAVALGVAPEAGRKGDDRRWRSPCLPARPAPRGARGTKFAPIVLRILRRTWAPIRTERTCCRRSSSACSRRIHDLKDLRRPASVRGEDLPGRRAERAAKSVGAAPPRPDPNGRAARASDCRRGLRGAPGDRPLPPAARRPGRRRPRALRPPLRREDGAHAGRGRARLVADEDEATPRARHRARHLPDAARSRARRIRHRNDENNKRTTTTKETIDESDTVDVGFLDARDARDAARDRGWMRGRKRRGFTGDAPEALTAAAPSRGLAPDTRFFIPAPNPGASRQFVDLVKNRSFKDALRIAALATTPQAVWFTDGTPAEVKNAVRKTMRDAKAQRRVPVLVAYNTPSATARSTRRAAPPTPPRTRPGSTASRRASAASRPS